MSNPGFEAPLSHVTEWSRPYSFLPAIESVFAPQIYSGPAPSQSQESNDISGIINSGSSSSSSNSGTAAALFLDRRQRADDAAAATNKTAEAEPEAAAEMGRDGHARQPPSLSDFGGSGAGSSPSHPYPGEAGFLGLGHAHSPARQQYQQSPLGDTLVAVESDYAARSHRGHAADLYEQTVGDSGMVVLPPPDLTIGHHESMCSRNTGKEGMDEDGEEDEDEQEGGNEEEETGGGRGGGTGSDAEEEEAVSAPQTASERMAQRRKMKRFRLTHQQTRFLMSEFSKQPHPDAAHRECLSREIPGLSPRQVQVWFQNRRAKIKRLAADDRERVIKMRAVPDDFDNVQALHSPYGAVHGLGAPPLASPVDYAASPYADHPGQRLPQPPSYPQQPPPPQQQQQHLAAPSGLAAAFALGAAFPLASAPGTHGHVNACFGRVPTVPSSTTSSSSSSMSSLSSSASSSSNSNSNSGVVIVDSDLRSRPLQLLQPLRPSLAWKGDAFDFSAMAGVRALPQQPAQTSSLPFLSAAAVATTAAGSLHYDGSTAAVRVPSFWGLQPQR